jgi:conflict system pore-forming effector with SLATT domain
MDELATLSWQPGHRAESLDVLARQALGQVRGAAAWYDLRRGQKRLWALALRLGAILLFSIAGLLPLLSQVFTDNGKPVIQPVWASVALALAAALVGLDRYFGFSSAWMRFMLSQLSLKSLGDDFELAWQAERSAWPDGEPTAEQLSHALESVRHLVATADGMVRDETSAWVTEFQGALKDLDDSLRTRADET